MRWFRKEKFDDGRVSLNKKAWRRLKKNKAAVFGMVVIGLAALTAIFAYAIAPDKTTYANEQIVQLDTHPPGFSIEMLKVTRDKPKSDKGFFSRFFLGQDSKYEWIPINSYRIDGDKVVFEEYRGEYLAPEEGERLLVDVAFARSTSNREVNSNNGKVSFEDIEGNAQEIEIGELTQIVEADHIKTKTFLLGTDKYGRDILSRIIIGVRISFMVGTIAVVISLFIGITLGAFAGYFRGWVDDLIMWLINTFWSIPTLLLALGLFVGVDSLGILDKIPLFKLFDPKVTLLFIALGLTMWVSMARIVRGQFLSIREKEFVEACQSLGFNNLRTIFIHILPNIVGPIIVIAAANFANAILVEAGMSFIGLGIQPPQPSWGAMLNEYKDYLNTPKGYLAVFPGIAIMFLVLSFNLIGNGLRDALDVKSN